MVSAKSAPTQEVVKKVAEELKKVDQIKAPEWALYVKTGTHKERPPVETDWWYMRTASILKNVYYLGPIGVSKLRTKYGGKKDRGAQPEKFFRGSGNIIRKALQQLESAELIKKGEKGIHKGRVITPKGISILDKAGVSITGKPKKKAELKIETKKKEKKPELKKEVKKEPEKKVEEKKEVKEKPKTEVKKEVKPKEEKKTEVKAEEKSKEQPKTEEQKEKVPTTHELAEKKEIKE